MKRSDLNFLVDLVSFFTLLGLAGTGAIIKWVLPPGSGGLGRELHGGHGGEHSGEHIRELLGMGRHDWGEVHLWLGTIFVVLMLVHLVLHWGWVKYYVKLFGTAKKQPREKDSKL